MYCEVIRMETWSILPFCGRGGRRLRRNQQSGGGGRAGRGVEALGGGIGHSTSHPMQENVLFHGFCSLPVGEGRPNTNIPFIIHYFGLSVNRLSMGFSGLWNLMRIKGGFPLRTGILLPSEEEPQKSRDAATDEEACAEPKESLPSPTGALNGGGEMLLSGGGEGALQDAVGLPQHIRLVYGFEAAVPSHDEIGFLEHAAIARSHHDHIFSCPSEHAATSLPAVVDGDLIG